MSSETTKNEISNDINIFKSNSEWTKFSGSNLDDWASRIATGMDGSIYQLGFTDGSFDNENNNGKVDFFIIKFNSEGEKIWTKFYGTSEDDTATGITTGNDGSLYVIGRTSGDLFGIPNSSGSSGDAFISKFDSDGNELWTKLISSRAILPNNVIKGRDNFFYTFGYTQGDLLDQKTQTNGVGMQNADAYFIKFDDLGNIKLAKLFGSRSYDSARDLVVCRDGYIYITGSTENYAFGDYTSTDRETYTDTTTATDRDLDGTDTESVCICRHTGPNLSPPPLVLVVVVLLSSPIAEGRSLFSLRGHL